MYLTKSVVSRVQSNTMDVNRGTSSVEDALCRNYYVISLLILCILGAGGCNDDLPSAPPLPPFPELGVLCETGCDLGVELEIDEGVVTPECNDDLDNDGDGKIDGFDPGCDDLNDPDERDPDMIPACSDGIDNDGDGKIDYPNDPECESPESPFESRPPMDPPECSDGIDNDDDGNIDYPIDLGCAAPNDLIEGDDPPTIPQCSDELDNDGDEFIDISDPGCESPMDPLELNGSNEDRPWCSDGIDNDGDGLTDFPRDPGCAFAGDNDELTPPFPSACNDDEDNDGDELIDFPLDPGCAGVGDDDETDRERPPQCADGIDNDSDGKADYPEDAGCLSRGDDRELGACGEVFESEILRDGVTVRGVLSQGSFMARGSCGGQSGREIVFRYVVRDHLQALIISTDLPGNEIESALYVRRRCSEPETEIVCQREPIDGDAAQTLRVEDPELGEYFIFFDAADNAIGPFAIRLDEEKIPECRNEIDDDFNGLTDFPTDPGCETPYDFTERIPLETPACSDEIDNDEDSLTDYPNDYGCLFAGDTSEEDLCGQGVPVAIFPTGRREVEGSTAQEGSSHFEGTCGGANIQELVYYYEQPFSAAVTFSVNHPETLQPTLLHVRRNQCLREGVEGQWINEIGCNVGTAEEGKAELTIDQMSPGGYYIFVDHPEGVGGPFKLSVSYERLPPSCQNEVDDDRDGFIDGEDLGCLSRNDDQEGDDIDLSDPNTPRPVCFDFIDNDEDGLTDFPYDPGCEGKLDEDETDPERMPACSNGLDDDRDMLIDLEDPGCSHAGDGVEEDLRPNPQCNNRLDDDQDGRTDFPWDPHCLTLGDLSEFDDGYTLECGDSIDNDEDGFIDFPEEPGCISSSDPSESNEGDLPECSNEIDDDLDELIDYPQDPGCDFAGDRSEETPEVIPQCANGIDDDGDRQTDWPNDAQCLSASDRSERL